MKRKKHIEASEGPPKNERIARKPEPEVTAPVERGARFSRFKASFARVVTVTLKLAVVAAIVACAGFLGHALEGFVRTSPAFALEAIAVTGHSRLTEQEVVEASGITLGENVFRWPPEEVEAKLVAHPWIARASVRRKLPSRFEIEIREHAPRALLALDSLYLVSREGVVFKELGAGETFDLPVVTVADEAAIRSSREQRAALLTEVAALLRDVEAIEPRWASLLSEVHVHTDGAFTLRFGEDGTEVRLGKGDLEGKLTRIRRVFERLEQAGLEAARVFADNERRPDRVTVEIR